MGYRPREERTCNNFCLNSRRDDFTDVTVNFDLKSLFVSQICHFDRSSPAFSFRAPFPKKTRAGLRSGEIETPSSPEGKLNSATPPYGILTTISSEYPLSAPFASTDVTT
jgi:hypothetical protein